MSHMRALILVAGLVGCGGAVDPGTSKPDPFDVEGEWPGRWVLGAANRSPSFPADTTVRIEGSRLRGACPGGDGEVTLTRAPDGWRWSGSLACAPVDFAGCSGAATTVTSAWVYRQGTGWLAAWFQGSGTLCGSSATVHPAFGGYPR